MAMHRGEFIDLDSYFKNINPGKNQQIKYKRNEGNNRKQSESL